MGREPQIGRVVPGCSQNSRHPLLSSSVILSMKRSFLTTASHYKMAALLSDSQCHLRSEKENQDNSGRSCVSFSSVQFSSVAQSCPTLCDPMNRSMPGLPVYHQLPEFTQTHVHRVSDAIF